MEKKQELDRIEKELGDAVQEVNYIGLNAHIEASKADGEAGRRFSIVSQEMTKVAQKLDNSLKELKKLNEEEDNESM